MNPEDHDVVGDELDGVNQEDSDLFDLFDEGNSNEQNEDELDELDPQDGDSPEVLLTKVKAKNKIIRQREKALDRVLKENEQLQSQLQSGQQLGKQDIADLISAVKGDGDGDNSGPDMEALAEQFQDDPTNIVKFMLQQNQQLEQKLADVLQRRDQHFEKKLSSAQRSEEPKEVLAIAEKLKARPEYSAFNDEQLITVAKTMAPMGKKIRRAPASTASRPLPMTASNQEVEQVSQSALEAMGYTDED